MNSYADLAFEALCAIFEENATRAEDNLAQVSAGYDAIDANMALVKSGGLSLIRT